MLFTHFDVRAAAENRKHNLALNAHVHAKGKFMGNTVGSIMDGEAQLYLTDRYAFFCFSALSIVASQ